VRDKIQGKLIPYTKKKKHLLQQRRRADEKINSVKFAKVIKD